MTTALYLPTSEPGRFMATPATSGPWDDSLQHGGPPSALLARAAEREPAAWPATVVRIAVEILGPTPVGEVAVESHLARSGRSVELIEAQLSASGRVAARARAWRVRQAALDLPAGVSGSGEAPPMPAADTPSPTARTGGFINALDVRFAVGGWNEPGPATAWARLRVPLVDGEEPTGLQRLMTLADCGNGISSALPITDWLYINPDLTVHLTRYPQGEWQCIAATSTIDPSGFGLATSTLYDAHGVVGHGAQSLFVDHR